MTIYIKTHNTKKISWQPIRHINIQKHFQGATTVFFLNCPSDIHVARGDSTRAFWNETSRPPEVATMESSICKDVRKTSSRKGLKRWWEKKNFNGSLLHVFLRGKWWKKSQQRKNRKTMFCHHKEVSAGMVPCWSAIWLNFCGKSLHYLVGGFNPSEKYILVKLEIFPK